MTRLSLRLPPPGCRNRWHGDQRALDFAEDQFSGFNAEFEVFLALLHRGGAGFAPSAASRNPVDRTWVAEEIRRVHRARVLYLVLWNRWHHSVVLSAVH